MDPLIVIGVKLVESIYTNWKNRQQVAELKKVQRAAKEDELINNQRRDLNKFKLSCQFQEEMERENHKEKIQTIADNFLKSIELMFQKDNLDSHYMLNVSPYVLQRSLIPLSVKDIYLPDIKFEELYGKDLSKESLYNVREKFLCILSGSNNSAFNKDVLPYLDDAICDVISTYWNERSNHTIVYYEDMWNCDKGPYSHDRLGNLRSSIPNATLVITPFFEPCAEKPGKQELVLKLNMWIHKEEEISEAEVPTNLYFDTTPISYSLKEINEIVPDLTTNAVCAIGQMADLFYWATEHKPPLLPYLMGKGVIDVSESTKDRIISYYSHWYRSYAIGEDKLKFSNDPECHQLISDIIEINQYNHPERSLACLNSIIALTAKSPLTSEMIKGSMLSFYRARTDKTPSSIDSIDASLIKKQDIMYVKMLIELTQQAEDHELKRELSELIYKYITSWR